MGWLNDFLADRRKKAFYRNMLKECQKIANESVEHSRRFAAWAENPTAENLAAFHAAGESGQEYLVTIVFRNGEFREENVRQKHGLDMALGMYSGAIKNPHVAGAAVCRCGVNRVEKPPLKLWIAPGCEPLWNSVTGPRRT